MNKKRRLVCLCVILLMLAGMLSACGTNRKKLSILDKSGELIVEVDSKYTLDTQTLVYCDVVIEEATQILSQELQCSESDAKDALWKEEYKIYTYFDKKVQDALTKACYEQLGKFDCGSAITDLEGNLVAVYSHSMENDGLNYAKHLASPYSALKPLSVYSQAVERGLINWSSTYEDSAYKLIDNSNGTQREWPANANGEYSGTDVTIYEAVRRSLNTTAVKCLKDVGVNTSMEFLDKNFGLPLSSEQYTATIYGEEEIIGNIALGSLKEGVDPVDMAGYYQIFANGGKYEKPASVYRICDKDGNEIYEREYMAKDVISPVTSDVMNKLLQGVVKTGGTGVEAYCGDIEVAGKTGSSDGNADCWFVGVSPEYSCAVWHGKYYKNLAPYVFSNIIKGIYDEDTELKKNFALHSNLNKAIYCEVSGMSISPNCTSIQMGYYIEGTELEMCNQH